MIKLTDIKGEDFILNADQIIKIEEVGDTMITCSNGTKYRVIENPKDILQKVLAYQQNKWIPMVNSSED
jgi:flagellar protein FlbD